MEILAIELELVHEFIMALDVLDLVLIAVHGL
jgi:hypothetical protein